MNDLDHTSEEKRENSDKGPEHLDVVGFGNLNWDRLLFVDRLANKGEEISIKNVWEGCGGSAANTTTWLSSFGRKMAFIGSAGTDKEGEQLISSLKSEGINTSMIRKVKGRTGSAFGIVDREGERTLYTYGGVGSKISKDQIDYELLDNCSVIHASSFLNDEPMRTQEEIARNKDAIFSFNPGPLCIERPIEDLERLISRSDILFLNTEEMCSLLDHKNENENFECNEKKGSERLLGLGVGIVVLTRGKKGSYITNGSEEYKIPAPNVDMVIDTTGAGDAYAAGFIEGVLRDYEIEECGKLGSSIAAKCISKYGGNGLTSALP